MNLTQRLMKSRLPSWIQEDELKIKFEGPWFQIWACYKCVVAALTSVATDVYFDGYSSIVVDVCSESGVSNNHLYFLLEEIVCQNFPKGEIDVPFGLVALWKTTWRNVQTSSAAKGTHVKHDVPTCVLQLLVSYKRHMLLQLWFCHTQNFDPSFFISTFFVLTFFVYIRV